MQLVKKRVVIGANMLLFGSAALVLLISLLCFVATIVFGEWNSNATLYWFTFSEHIQGDVTWAMLQASLIIGIAFAILVGVTWLLRQDKSFNRIGARSVILLLFAWMLIFGMYFVQFFQFGPFSTWKQLQTVNLGDHVYHLLEFAYDATETHYYRFYECDRFDLFCQELYSTSPLGCKSRPCDDRIFR